MQFGTPCAIAVARMIADNVWISGILGLRSFLRLGQPVKVLVSFPGPMLHRFLYIVGLEVECMVVVECQEVVSAEKVITDLLTSAISYSEFRNRVLEFTFFLSVTVDWRHRFHALDASNTLPKLFARESKLNALSCDLYTLIKALNYPHISIFFDFSKWSATQNDVIPKPKSGTSATVQQI